MRNSFRVVPGPKGPTAYCTTATGGVYHLRHAGDVIEFVARHPWADDQNLMGAWAEHDPGIRDPNAGTATVEEALDMTREVNAAARRARLAPVS